MGETWRNRVRSLFDVRGLGWQVLIPLIILIGGTVGVGSIVFWKSVRDALSDFLTSDVEVWHLLIAVIVALGAEIIVIMRPRRTGSPPKGASWPREIDRYGVRWPITAVRSNTGLEFEAGRPGCFKCRTPLGRDLGDGVEPLPIPGAWKNLPTEAMTFRCPKDDLVYDLTKYQIPMWWAIKDVEGDATGTYDTALAAKR